MAYHWPADTVFHELTLEVDDRTCWQCQYLRTVCCHRQRRFFTCAGPVQLVCKLCHCSNPACSEHQSTVSPEEETALVMPYWVLGWKARLTMSGDFQAIVTAIEKYDPDARERAVAH
jgi:hypothetical protein